MIVATLALVGLFAAETVKSPLDHPTTGVFAPATPIDLGLQISITPPEPVLGVTQEVSLTITSSSGALPAGAWAALRVLTSAGEVQDLTPSGPTACNGRLALPTRRAPQGLIVAAQLRSENLDLAGALILPLPALASPAFHTDPGAQVTLTVAGRVFGPESAGASGDVRVPVIVPPGAAVAMARSTNAMGKIAEEVLNLGLPPFSRMLVLAPPTAIHGRPTEVLVFGMDAQAAPSPPHSFALRSNGRLAQPLHGGPGWRRFLAVPPLLDTHTRMHLTAYEKDPARGSAPPPLKTAAVMARAEVALLPGPVAKLFIIPNRVALVVGSSQRLALIVRAEDMWGEPTSTSNTHLYVNGVAVVDATANDGRLRAWVPAPQRAPTDARLIVEAIDGRAYARHEVVLESPGGVQAAPEPVLPLMDYSWAALARAGPSFGADTGMGFGTTADVQVQLGRWIHWPQGLFLQGSVSYVGHQRDIVSNTGLSRLRLHALPLLIGAAWRVSLMRSVRVFLGLQAGPTRLWATNSTLGANLTGGAWTPAFRLAADAVFGNGHTQIVVGASFTDISGGKLSSGDKLRGNLGGAAVSLGIRQRW